MATELLVGPVYFRLMLDECDLPGEHGRVAGRIDSLVDGDQIFAAVTPPAP